jgi:hypothetical protein
MSPIRKQLAPFLEEGKNLEDHLRRDGRTNLQIEDPARLDTVSVSAAQ